MKFDDEFYTKVISVFERRISYNPGSLLEEKIIGLIKRKKRFNITKIAAVIAIAAVLASILIFNNINTVNQRPLFTSYENTDIQNIPKKYEPIINISLVSDGF
ncbi:MAG: hypothetical protein PWP54_1000 [Thermosipho sp. (in: thermotogales)]|nr:hypothetical protein [Thermosipho sp. (in: thermotogales)]